MKEPLVKDGNRPNCPLLEYTLNVHNVFVFLWASFSFIFGLFRQTLQIFTTNVCEKMSIQYMAPGFEPTTLGT